MKTLRAAPGRRVLVGLGFALLFFFSRGTLWAVTGIGGTTGANFLKIGVGARPLAMGEAFVAVADDANGAYWNPSGLANLDTTTTMFEHALWFDDINYEYVVVAQPAEAFGLPIWGALAFSWFYLHTGDTTRTIENSWGDVENAGTFSMGDTALGISYGGQATNFQSFGFTLKMINQKIDYLSQSSMCFDFGLMSASPVKNLRMGMMLSNMGGSLGGGQLPTTFKAGTMYKLAGRDIPGEFITAFDVTLPLIISDQTVHVAAGEEYTIKFKPHQFSLRMGYRNGRDMGSPSDLTFGLGYQLAAGRLTAGVDYAFLEQGDLGYTHHFAFTVSF